MGMDYDVFIDWDMQIKNEKQLKDKIRRSLDRMNGIKFITQNLKVKGIWYRLSSNDHIHLKLNTEIDDIIYNEIDTFMILMLSLRAVFYDDAYRIAIDLIRFAEFQDIKKVNRLFDAKITDSFNIAGRWVRLQ